MSETPVIAAGPALPPQSRNDSELVVPVSSGNAGSSMALCRSLAALESQYALRRARCLEETTLSAGDGKTLNTREPANCVSSPLFTVVPPSCLQSLSSAPPTEAALIPFAPRAADTDPSSQSKDTGPVTTLPIARQKKSTAKQGNNSAVAAKSAPPPTAEPPAAAPEAPKPGPPTAVGIVLDLSDPVSFAYRPAPRGASVRCSITRSRGLLNTSYECVLEATNSVVMCARKLRSARQPQYSFSTATKTFDRRSPHFLGKLRSNFVGTEFIAHDYGLDPAKMKPDDVERTFKLAQNGAYVDSMKRLTQTNDLPPRRELCAILYESNVGTAARGPRRMTVLLPRVSVDDEAVAAAAAAAAATGQRLSANGGSANSSAEEFKQLATVWRPRKPSESMVPNFRAEIVDGLLLGHNKPPRWDEAARAYVLHFGGRVTMASVKNFQLVLRDRPDEVVLQFGRTGKDTFTMDFTWPISPYQAFAISISSLDSKLACE